MPAIAEEFIELIDDVTGKVVRCRKFVAPPVNPEWPLYFTNAAREREQRADATIPIVDWPGIRARGRVLFQGGNRTTEQLAAA